MFSLTKSKLNIEKNKIVWNRKKPNNSLVDLMNVINPLHKV